MRTSVASLIRLLLLAAALASLVLQNPAQGVGEWPSQQAAPSLFR